MQMFPLEYGSARCAWQIPMLEPTIPEGPKINRRVRRITEAPNPKELVLANVLCPIGDEALHHEAQASWRRVLLVTFECGTLVDP